MKLRKLILAATTLFTLSVQAQTQDSLVKRECDRMRFLANQESQMKNYAAASSYYLKGEKICNNYDKKKYDILVGYLRNTITTETDKTKKELYIDTLLNVYNRMEAKGHYDLKNDLVRAQYLIDVPNPNRQKADSLFVRGINTSGATLTDKNVVMYYYNLNLLYNEGQEPAKAAYKKRMISEYFALSTKVTDNKMSDKTQEALNGYFNNTIKNCSDILPDLNGYLKVLPQNPTMKKTSVNNFIKLLETKGCTSSKEYETLIDTLIKIDPTIDAAIAKAKLLRSKKRYSDAIEAYRNARTMTTDVAKKEEIEFEIGQTQYESGSYNSAYQTFMGISGKDRSDALLKAAACVSKTANSCGTSTFERLSNNLYAAELAERAGSNSMAAKYRAAGPSKELIFQNGGPQTVSLSCWGVKVSVK